MPRPDASPSTRPHAQEGSVALLEQLGHVLMDCMRLSRQAQDTQQHLLEAMRVCMLDAGWHTEPSHSEAMCPWQEALALRMLASDDHSRSIAAIAASCCLPMPQFSRAFKARHGVTPQRWRLMQRIERAKHLMHDTAMSLTDIAFECGFAEQSHFTHAFVKLAGMPPRSWRLAVRPAETVVVRDAGA